MPAHPPRSAPRAGAPRRTFAAWLQPPPPEPVPLFDYPHRGAVEHLLGEAVTLRAWLDPTRCAERGVEGYVEGGVARFASADPPLALALRLAGCR